MTFISADPPALDALYPHAPPLVTEDVVGNALAALAERRIVGPFVVQDDDCVHAEHGEQLFVCQARCPVTALALCALLNTLSAISASEPA